MSVNPWPSPTPLLRWLVLKPFPSCFHQSMAVNPWPSSTSLLRQLVLKPFPSCFHVSEPLTKSHPSFKTTFSKSFAFKFCLAFAVRHYKTFFLYVVGENAPKENLYHAHSGWKFTSDFYMMKLSWCTLWWKFTHDPFSKYRWIFIQSVRCTKTRMWQFFKLLIHQHTSCQHVAKRAVAKVKKFSRRSSKMEGVMNF